MCFVFGLINCHSQTFKLCAINVTLYVSIPIQIVCWKYDWIFFSFVIVVVIKHFLFDRLLISHTNTHTHIQSSEIMKYQKRGKRKTKKYVTWTTAGLYDWSRISVHLMCYVFTSECKIYNKCVHTENYSSFDFCFCLT